MLGRKILAAVVSILVLIGFGVAANNVAQASPANAGVKTAVTFAGKICVRGDSTHGLYVRNYVGQSVYLRQLDCSYNRGVADVNAFFQSSICTIQVGNALYMGGGWEGLSNSLTVRTAYVHCLA